jgi:hypothetical protein
MGGECEPTHPALIYYSLFLHSLALSTYGLQVVALNNVLGKLYLHVNFCGFSLSPR